jgi:hypothetical protein
MQKNFCLRIIFLTKKHKSIDEISLHLCFYAFWGYVFQGISSRFSLKPNSINALRIFALEG